ncbi:MAG: hypothetical protein AAF502_15725 [Bacteroidota bacterium]
MKIQKPNAERIQKSVNFTYIHTYNSLGLREKEISEPLPENTFTILALGDSYTEGVGAPGDSTWPVLTERLLNDQTQDTTVDVINSGIAGSDPVFAYKLVETFLVTYDFEMVILALNTSDIYDLFVRGGDERFTESGEIRFRNGPKWEFFYGSSYIFRVIIHDVLKYDFRFLRPHEIHKQEAKAIDLINHQLIKFQQLANKEDFKFVIVINPTLHEVKNNESDLESVETYARDSLEIPVLNLLEGFKNDSLVLEKGVDHVFWPVDFHNNSKGYTIWSKLLAEFLLKEGLN